MGGNRAKSAPPGLREELAALVDSSTILCLLDSSNGFCGLPSFSIRNWRAELVVPDLAEIRLGPLIDFKTISKSATESINSEG